MKMYAATIPADVLKIRPRELYYARQKQLFILLFLVVAVVPLVLINWYATEHYQDSWLKKTAVDLAYTADSRKEIITMFLADQERQLADFVELYEMRQLSRQPTLEKLFGLLKRDGVITDLGVIDRNGNHLAYVGPFARELANKNYAAAPWFQEVMVSGRYISDTFTGYRKVPHVIIAVADPEKSWLLRATINSELFNSLVASANVGHGGDAFIVSIAGELQTPSRYPARKLFSPQQVGVLQEIAGYEDGTTRLGGSLFTVKTLKDGAWLLVLESNIDSSLEEFYKAKNFGIFIIVVASLVIFIVAVVLITSMMNRIAKADSQRMTLTDNVRQVEKMALVGRLAASVAHEINNPLQVITDQAGWMNELLDEEKPENVVNYGEYRESLQKVRAQVKRAGTITHRLLGFSRLRDEEWSPVNLNHAVEETIALLENEARNHQILIRRDYAKDLPAVTTDASQLQQVFLNVLNNAMDAIGIDGEIKVTTQTAANQLQVIFADNGPGLPPEVIGRIFDSFFTTKQRGKGTGLGLSISHNIMERLGGTITAANRDGGGSVFTVSLPGITREAAAAYPALRGKLAMQG